MGKKRRGKKRGGVVVSAAEPSTPLERVVLGFLSTVQQFHREEVEVTRAMGSWMGRVTEKVLDAGLEVVREERERKSGVI